MSLNILILSAGRRVELVNLFKKTISDNNIKAKVIAADLQKNAPALFYADEKVILPHVLNGNYVEELVRYCNSYNVRWVIPTIDTELKVLSKNQEYIESNSKAQVMISSKNVINICRDKIETSKFFFDNNLGAPKEYKIDEINEEFTEFPVFAKPKSGSSSKDIFKLNNFDEFSEIINRIEDPIIQEYIEGDEFSVDVFVNENHLPISVVPRLRIATRGGEILKGKIIKDKEIIDEVKTLIKKLKPFGHITVQLFKSEDGIKFIEINPRFGGGAPMSILSGANSCKYLFDIALGKNLLYTEDYEDNITFLRFDRSICINDDMEIIHDKSTDF
ncbi:ATP-grasp domain-containing protein [Macrococcoides caseolyticum]|uniref:ATP-grasp domain-containing protein n=1 Tax=Macrococcoides caseolyticum TaxID=69966 RepID=UPI001060F9C9|nr:ATP-grasp domain-containing protein [Macrococcus caseolyticus]TDM19515.1 ATP-grasp domain-containing protein [Macrococcus caseolyticus]VUC67812.1 carbamoyl phosphate synthase-like protein [Macrococcus caseolyticus]